MRKHQATLIAFFALKRYKGNPAAAACGFEMVNLNSPAPSTTVVSPSKSRIFVWGALGGLTPVVASLLAAEGYPLTTYVSLLNTSPTVLSDLILLALQTVFFALLGAIWPILNGTTEGLKAFQLGIAAPALILGTLAARDYKDAISADPITETVQQRASGAAVAPAGMLFAQLGGAGFVADNLSIADLPKLFDGVERRVASDRLIRLYRQDRDNRAKVVQSVIDAILPDRNTSSYRVNLYVARTLRLIPGGWDGSASQRAKIEALRNTSSYERDETFRENVDAALENWTEAS